MSVVTRPRHPLVDTALDLARTWCAGHIIDDVPALGRAIRVALTLGWHLPAAPPELIAAALLHDSPEFATDIDLDQVLTVQLGPAVTRVVRALEAEHAALDTTPGGPPIPVNDRWVLHASAADKIVALTSMLRRAQPPVTPQHSGLTGAPPGTWCSVCPQTLACRRTCADHRNQPPSARYATA